jgi:hypothetical protein
MSGERLHKSDLIKGVEMKTKRPIGRTDAMENGTEQGAVPGFDLVGDIVSE